MIFISITLHIIVMFILNNSPQHLAAGLPVSNIEMLLAEPAATNGQVVANTVPTSLDYPEPALESSSPDSAAPENPLSGAEGGMQNNIVSFDHNSIGFGLTNGFFSSLGDGETLRDDLREYYLQLLKEVNSRWWQERQTYKTPARAIMVNMLIARNGEVIDIRLLQSSGSRNDDQALLKTLTKITGLPVLPDSYQGELFVAPLRFNAPLNLLRPAKQN